MSKQIVWTVVVVGVALLGLWNLSFMMGQGTSVQGLFDPLQNAYDLIQSRFYRADQVQQTDLVHGGLRGMVEQLKDPYSNYLTAEEYERFNRGLEGEFVGVGINIGIRQDRLTVISPIPDSPAQRAGARAGDVILAIDGTDTAGMTLEEAVSRLRGVSGTEVLMHVLHRDGSEETLTVVRDVIRVPTVETRLLDDGQVGYLRLYTFNENAGHDVQEALGKFQKDGVRGIVFDLRGNGGGLLSQAVQVGSQFIDSGTVVSTTDRDAGRDYKSFGNRWTNVPVAVLIDGGTASASEIVAGAIQDTHMGALVGQQSFGKGVVQTLFPMGDGSVLKLTTSEYLTPLGRHVQGDGLSPDVPVIDALELLTEATTMLQTLKASVYTLEAHRKVRDLLDQTARLAEQYLQDAPETQSGSAQLLADFSASRDLLLAAGAEDDVPQQLEALEGRLAQLSDALQRSPLNVALGWLRDRAGQLCPCEATAQQP